MDEQGQAQALVAQLLPVERMALEGLMQGESRAALGHRLGISQDEADDLCDALRWKLGVLRDAEAVRIGLIAGSLEANDADKEL